MRWRRPSRHVKLSICPQADLLQPCGLSADLDVLNELSRGVTLADAAARRLQRLDRCWAVAAGQAEETCRSDVTRRGRGYSYRSNQIMFASTVASSSSSREQKQNGRWRGCDSCFCNTSGGVPRFLL